MSYWLRNLPQRISFWIMLGVIVWAVTFSWGWHQNRVAAERDVAIVHSQNVQTCVSLNELRRQIYVTAIDLGVAPALANSFLPTERCDRLP